MIWDAVNETAKAQLHSNLSKLFTGMELAGDLNVNTLSGGVLTPLCALVKHSSSAKSQFDTTVNNDCT